MDIDNLGGDSEGVSAQAPAASPTATSNDEIKNLKAEMNRKLSKINDLKQELKEIKQVLLAPSQRQVPVEETDENAPDYKRYVDARFSEARQADVKAAHERDFKEALNKFPELDENGDQFDKDFYQLVDKLYTKRSKDADPEALKEAVEVAAVRLGKIERLTQDKIMKDEARRSRIIAEGGSTPRENRKEKELQLNEKGLARLGINADKLRARIKANKEKYGE